MPTPKKRHTKPAEEEKLNIVFDSVISITKNLDDMTKYQLVDTNQYVTFNTRLSASLRHLLKATTMLSAQQEMLVNQIKGLNEKLSGAGGDENPVESVNNVLHGQQPQYNFDNEI